MLNRLVLRDVPPASAESGASSHPPASTKKPLENKKKRRSRKDMKGEKTVDRRQKISTRLVELQQERIVLQERLRELLPKIGGSLKQVLIVLEKLEDVEESLGIVEAET